MIILLTLSMSRLMAILQTLNKLRLTAILQTLNKLRLVAISGLIKSTKCEEKYTRCVLLLYTYYNKLI